MKRINGPEWKQIHADYVHKESPTAPIAITATNSSMEGYLEVTLPKGDLELFLDYKDLGTPEELKEMKEKYEDLRLALKKFLW